jgi:nitrate reductase delta subunit
VDSALAVELDYPAAAPIEVQRRYVADFDLSGPSSLYLTYHRYGDDRQRGRALIALRRLLREAGWELEHWELPDYLPLLVELAAVDPEVGYPLLREYRPEIERVADALHRNESPWAPALDRVLDEIRPEEWSA